MRDDMVWFDILAILLSDRNEIAAMGVFGKDPNKVRVTLTVHEEFSVFDGNFGSGNLLLFLESWLPNNINIYFKNKVLNQIEL